MRLVAVAAARVRCIRLTFIKHQYPAHPSTSCCGVRMTWCLWPRTPRRGYWGNWGFFCSGVLLCSSGRILRCWVSFARAFLLGRLVIFNVQRSYLIKSFRVGGSLRCSLCPRCTNTSLTRTRAHCHCPMESPLLLSPSTSSFSFS